MRRAVKILPLLILLPLLLSGCKGRSLQDVELTSVRLVSIVPQGLTGVSAVLEVGVRNPSAAFNLTDLEGMAKFHGEEVVSLSAEPLSVPARSEDLYQLPLEGRLASGFGVLRLIRLLGQGAEMDDVTFDLRGRVALRSGIGKNFEMLDVPLSSLLEAVQTDRNNDEDNPE